jgi:type II secretory pathway component GspD/PulD (secretin)
MSTLLWADRLAAGADALADDRADGGAGVGADVAAEGGARAGPSPVQLPMQIELPRLVDLAAAHLGIAVEYDPAVLKGTVLRRAAGTVDSTDLWNLTNDLLVSRGFTTVIRPGSDLFSVVRLADARRIARVDHSWGEAEAAPGNGNDHEADRQTDRAARFEPGFVSRVVRLTAARPKDVIDPLAAILTDGVGQAMAIGDTPMVLISDVTPRVEEAIALVALLDSSSVRTTRIYTPTRFAIGDVAVLAQRLVDARASAGGGSGGGAGGGSGGGRGGGALSSAAMGAPTGTGIALARDGASAAIVVDDLTNTLVVTADAATHEEIEALLARLEAMPSDGARPMRTFAIRNRPVADILGTLSTLVETGAFEAAGAVAGGAGVGDSARATQSSMPRGSSGSGVGGSAGVAPAALVDGPGLARALNASTSTRSQGQGSGLTLAVDAQTNTLIAVGEPRLLTHVARVIETLDVREPQVMVEVLLVTLSDSDSVNLGIELDKLDTLGDARVRLASLFGLGSAAAQTAAAVGGTAAIFSPGEFSVLIRAVQSLNQGRSVSVPRLMVNNNQPARFSSTVQQPFATSNATNSSTTITFGGTQSAGTTISVTPQISEGDHLVLTYSVSLSAFVGAASAGLPPPRQENSVDSVATIPDGYTVGVGGLTLTTLASGATQVPLIAEIPVLGELFRSRSSAESTSRFFVFIRANVLRSESMLDLRHSSDAAAAEAGIGGASGSGSGGTSGAGWPQIEPRVVR